MGVIVHRVLNLIKIQQPKLSNVFVLCKLGFQTQSSQHQGPFCVRKTVVLPQKLLVIKPLRGAGGTL